MHETAPRERSASATLSGALATLGLTAAHHAYGAARYGTPWRLHGAIGAAAIGLALLPVFLVYRARAATPLGRTAGWLLAAVTLLVPVLVFGAFEGFYNHVVKDVLFLAGAPETLLHRLFPPPAYELPNDAWFEVSGILQVVPAAWAARASLGLVRALRAGGGRGAPLQHAT